MLPDHLVVERDDERGAEGIGDLAGGERREPVVARDDVHIRKRALPIEEPRDSAVVELKDLPVSLRRARRVREGDPVDADAVR